MNITNIKTGIVKIPLITPFKTALRTIDHIGSMIVKVETDSGIAGWGEAHPTGPITGESLGSVRGAIHEFILPKLMGKNVLNLEDTLNTLEASIVRNTSAKAAVEIAIYDLFARNYAIPLYRLLGGYRDKIETDLTISVNSPEKMAEDTEAAISRGFRILKVKVGLEPELDIARIGAVRKAAGPDAVIRIDANQGWSVRDSVRIMKKLESAGLKLELVEQPVVAHDFVGLKEVKERIDTPVLADEAMFSAVDAEKLISMRAADFLNIKLMKTGGIRNALKICTLAEIHGVECFMGCMMESKVSVTAAAHLACAKSIITRCDLDSPSLCKEDPVRGGIVIDGPWLKMTDAPGLGIEGVDGVVWD
ncbi:MAG: dipeptide epimerase [Candidatus Rifleibacteriota bacterium]